jgi:hypothetical protein
MAENRSAKFAIIAVAGSALAIVSALVIVPFLTTSVGQSESDQRRIVALESEYDFRSAQTVTRVDYVKVGDMEPNSARGFLDPFGKTMEGKSTFASAPKPGMTMNTSEWDLRDDFEAFEIYTIIRLPELFGGAADGLSSYRAYNTISLSVHCVSKYWNQEGRWHVADPCSGDIHRPWDGVAIAGPAAVGISGGGIVSTGQFSALASLDLAADSEGYIVAKRPVKSYDENGMPGEGRRLSFEDMDMNGRELLAASSASAGYQLPFPSSISGEYYLSDLRLSSGTWWQGDWMDSPPGAIEAVYNRHPLGSGVGGEQIVLTTYPLAEFPDMALNSPTIVNGSIDPSSERLSEEVDKIDMRVVKSLISADENSFRDLAIEATNEIGIFSVLLAPSKLGADPSQQVSGVLIWATSADGKAEMLLTVRASPAVDFSELENICRSLIVE